MTFPKLRWFVESEFEHPELLNHDALMLLDEVRDQFGRPLIITDSARLPTAAPTGSSKTSYHYKGQAFDLRIKHFTAQELWRLVEAVMTVARWVARRRAGLSGVELEIVWSSTDKHCHIAFKLGSDGGTDEFLVRAE